MKRVYEVTAEAFDGATDATDDLVKWIYAESVDQVIEAMYRFGATVYGPIEAPIELADYELPEQLEVFQTWLKANRRQYDRT